MNVARNNIRIRIPAFFQTITLVLVLLALSSPCEGFLGLPPLKNTKPAVEKGIPLLNELSQGQNGVILNVQLDVPEILQDRTASRLMIDGLKFELKNVAAVPVIAPAAMPVDVAAPAPAPVPVPASSKPNLEKLTYTLNKENLNPVTSKPLLMDILSHGSFISTEGQQIVAFDDEPSWQMRWEEGKSTGAIICTLNLPKDARRNDAVLPAGPVFLTYTIFSKDCLDSFVTKSKEYQEAIDQYYLIQEEELEKMSSTKNWGEKLVRFKKTFDNHDAIMKKQSEYFEQVPANHISSNAVLIMIREDLLLSTRGTVWTESKDGESVMLGTASLKA